jgi:hypothetical protein
VNFEFIKVMYEISKIIIGKTRIWEMLRDQYNDSFNRISRDKDVKMIVTEVCLRR